VLSSQDTQPRGIIYALGWGGITPLLTEMSRKWRKSNGRREFTCELKSFRGRIPQPAGDSCHILSE